MRLRAVLVAAVLAVASAGCPMDVERAALGILTEVEEEGGDPVLVWLS